MAVVRDLGTYPAGDEVKLRDLLADLRNSKVLVWCAVAVLTLLGVAFGLVRTPKYEVTTVLTAVNEAAGGSPMGGLSSLASEYGGLASLAGLNLQGGAAAHEDVAILKSELLTQKFIQDNDLMPILFAKAWDPVNRRWKVSDPEKVPTLWKAYRLFGKSIMEVTDDQKNDLIDVAITWKDPRLAAQWANGMVDLTNSYLRAKAIEDAQRNIAFLNDQLKKTNVVEEQQAISTLLEQEVNKEMLAKGRQQYALKVIDPAFPPEKPSTFGPVTLGLLGFAGGWLLSLFVVFGRRVLRE